MGCIANFIALCAQLVINNLPHKWMARVLAIHGITNLSYPPHKRAAHHQPTSRPCRPWWESIHTLQWSAHQPPRQAWEAWEASHNAQVRPPVRSRPG